MPFCFVGMMQQCSLEKSAHFLKVVELSSKQLFIGWHIKCITSDYNPSPYLYFEIKKYISFFYINNFMKNKQWLQGLANTVRHDVTQNLSSLHFKYILVGFHVVHHRVGRIRQTIKSNQCSVQHPWYVNVCELQKRPYKTINVKWRRFHAMVTASYLFIWWSSAAW